MSIFFFVVDVIWLGGLLFDNLIDDCWIWYFIDLNDDKVNVE